MNKKINHVFNKMDKETQEAIKSLIKSVKDNWNEED